MKREIDLAIVLAAGRGTRMRNAQLPKALVPYGGSPMLEYVLSGLVQGGFRRVVVVIGHLGELIQQHFGVAYRSMKIDYVVQSEPRGTADALTTALPLVCQEPAVLVTYCDIMIESNWYRRLASIWIEREKLVALITAVEADPSQGSLVVFDDAFLITDIRSRPPEITDGWRDGAVSVHSQESLSAMKIASMSARGEFQATEVIRSLILSKRAVGVAVYGGAWADLASADSIKQATNLLPRLAI